MVYLLVFVALSQGRVYVLFPERMVPFSQRELYSS